MQYGITNQELTEIGARDKACVYCHKQFDQNPLNVLRTDKPTIEHLNYRADWDSVLSYHQENKPVSEIVAICCGGCNSSRRDKPLLSWFKTEYCVSRGISYRSVDDVVKKFIDVYEK